MWLKCSECPVSLMVCLLSEWSILIWHYQWSKHLSRCPRSPEIKKGLRSRSRSPKPAPLNWIWGKVLLQFSERCILHQEPVVLLLFRISICDGLVHLHPVLLNMSPKSAWHLTWPVGICWNWGLLNVVTRSIDRDGRLSRCEAFKEKRGPNCPMLTQL